MPSRSDFHTLTRQRLDESNALLPLNFPDAAFYLAGYSIECALKAAVCRTLDQNDFYGPDRGNKSTRYVQDRVLREFKTHNYSDLLVLSGLSAKLNTARQTDPKIEAAWFFIEGMNWSEQSRYQLGTKSAINVYNFVQAVETIVIWISNFWQERWTRHLARSGNAVLR